ncbi:MAG: hydantoinase/oxoprolinase family protein, partial [Lentisphaeraceae bacterium]|nr:hydantoinase/oxoprolinase family protein [Lentisphaeraceae bacterium]
MNSESTKLNKQLWKFKVDVGGTFTDYLASSGEGRTTTGKILSNGCLRSNAEFVSENTFQDSSLSHYKDNFFKDFKVRIYKDGQPYESSVLKFEKGRFEIDGVLEGCHDFQYEIFTGEEAPVLVARLETETAIDEDFPAIDLNLGTTRGTNALLERKGAKVGLICNKGFKDVWDIGNQTRSDLFALNIKKPDSLISSIFEISGRLDKNGHEIEKLSESEVLSAVDAFHKAGIQSVAICLINSYINPEHENKVYSLIKNTFPHISVSHRITRTIKLLERGDTTLVDAYLSPIIKDYIQSIKDALPHAKIRMMTSAGGLVSPQNFSGKDSLLSGPAGGVNGFSYAAQSAGFKNAIGFDMGGTSTDVKRFGGEFEYHFESVKAGVRVVTPMFAIETVAAGGGSICSFDGQRILVGPESAGASPGPACYGAGGPLTVTDVNLFCGKIDRQAFPFKLDKEVVRLKLEQIADAVFESTGNRMSIHEVAAGFTKIADYKMAEAI